MAETKQLPNSLGRARRSDPNDSIEYYGRLLSLVRGRFGLLEEAADIVQDAYARLAMAAQRTTITNQIGFLRVTATNLGRDYIKAAKHRRAFADECMALADETLLDPLPDTQIINRQRLAIVEAALAELPVKRRAALVLYRFEELSHAEIAERLGISVSMVEKHVRLALRHCRAKLNMIESLGE